MGFPARSDKNQGVHPQKMARGLKFWIQEVEGLYYLCSENKGIDEKKTLMKTKALVSRAVIAQLICVFVFAYSKIRFSYDAAQLCLIASI